MSDDVMKDRDGNSYSYDNIRTQGWLDGHLPGLNLAVGWLKRQAIKLFEQGKDEEAIGMRKLADQMLADIAPDLQSRCNDHQKNHPDLLSAKDEP